MIASQLAAFQRDDALEAFSYASPGIQRQFANPENFMAMVKTGYRPVYRPLKVEFREIRILHGGPAQVIDIVGPDGKAMIAIYLMEQQPDGSWRIDGVYFSQETRSGGVENLSTSEALNSGQRAACLIAKTSQLFLTATGFFCFRNAI